MQIAGPLVQAIFLHRPNRFRVQVEINGREEGAHLADPGRLRELLTPGAELLLARQDTPHRKTRYDVRLVRHGAHWVSIDSRLPNRLVDEALRAGWLEPLRGYLEIYREIAHGQSRLDFCLRGPALPDCWVEVKSVTLVDERGRALFPDAPTLRGRKHVEELGQLVRRGYRAVALFVIQRADAIAFAPHEACDPDFAQALRQAMATGVEVYAYRCRIAPAEATITDSVPVFVS